MAPTGESFRQSSAKIYIFNGRANENIIAIHHTQSVNHANGMAGSWKDWELTKLGVEQAERIGRKLSEEIKGEGYVMYSSDLLRAKQTADIIAGYLEISPFIPMF